MLIVYYPIAMEAETRLDMSRGDVPGLYERVLGNVKSFEPVAPETVREAREQVGLLGDAVEVERSVSAYMQERNRVVPRAAVEDMVRNLGRVLQNHLGQNFIVWARQRGVPVEDSKRLRRQIWEDVDGVFNEFETAIAR